jgi:hypothetical protein
MTSGEIGIGATIKSSVTYGGAAYISAGTGVALTVHQFNGGPIGSRTVDLVTPWVMSNDVSDIISRIHVVLEPDTAQTLTVAVYTNFSGSPASSQSVTTGTATQHITVFRPNVRSAKSWKILLSYTSDGGGGGYEHIRVDGMSQGITF